MATFKWADYCLRTVRSRHQPLRGRVLGGEIDRLPIGRVPHGKQGPAMLVLECLVRLGRIDHGRGLRLCQEFVDWPLGGVGNRMITAGDMKLTEGVDADRLEDRVEHMAVVDRTVFHRCAVGVGATDDAA